IPAGLFCGEMDVPMDYTRTFHAKTNNMTIGFAMNRPAARIAIEGGPGENAAAQAWETVFNLSTAFEGLQDFDFLGASIPSYACIQGPAESLQHPWHPVLEPAQPLVRCFLQRPAVRFVRPCPVFAFSHTEFKVIQDWDTVRAALGYEKVRFAGVSSGTFVGLAYAVRYPHRVNQFVLDAAIPHGMPAQGVVTFQVAAANRLVQRADVFCLADPACPFYGKGKSSVVEVCAIFVPLNINIVFTPQRYRPGRPSSRKPPTRRSPHPAAGPRQTASRRRPRAIFSRASRRFFRSNPDFPLFNHASLHGDASLFAYVPEFFSPSFCGY
ncbi:hypothetical protein C8R47DRAFT_987998, partial [Mycena vitilis]